jgi:hypothetical protein
MPEEFPVPSTSKYDDDKKKENKTKIPKKRKHKRLQGSQGQNENSQEL